MFYSIKVNSSFFHLFAPLSFHHKLDNLIALIDVNKAQVDGWVADIAEMSHFKDRFVSFGWLVREVDGHDLEAMDQAIAEALEASDSPKAIALNTVKRKGIRFLEQMNPDNHHIPVSKEQEALMPRQLAKS